MELSGKVFKAMPVESGEGKNGVWKKQQIIIEIDNGKYPKKVAVVFWGDLVNSDAFAEGRDISVEFDVESREYNGKWYTDVKAWRINKTDRGIILLITHLHHTLQLKLQRLHTQKRMRLQHR
ncbi:MAG TPA: DUF3127 domain-containing protein [Chitinophagales bacterium]|nr:DUF3127 domain-containing protein [Chitinophagales bacterium]